MVIGGEVLLFAVHEGLRHNEDKIVTDQLVLKISEPQMGGQIRGGRIWRFWGAPIFSPEVPKYLFLKGLGTSGQKIGAPQKRQIQPRRIWPPICGPLRKCLQG